MKKQKKTLVWLLLSLMIFSLLGCQSKQEAADPAEAKEKTPVVEPAQSPSSEKEAPSITFGSFKPGTYVGEGEGIHGPIQVEVTVDETRVTDIKIVKHEETEGICEPALTDIPADIIEKQSLDVDIVSGATFTSEGVLEAVAKALKQAK